MSDTASQEVLPATVCPYRRCHLNDFSDAHFHSEERPNVTVFHCPEERVGLTTLHPRWGTDDGHSTVGSCATAEEAVDVAKRLFGATVVVPERSEEPGEIL